MVTIVKQECIGYQRGGASVIKNEWSDGSVDYTLSGNDLQETDEGYLYSLASPSTRTCPHIDIAPFQLSPSK